jgi:leader peptidase (prepilin peptidase)/N-methyltransferase
LNNWLLEIILLSLFLGIASAIDIKERIIPDMLTAVFLAAAILMRLLYHNDHSLIYYVAGAVTGFVILLVVSLMTNGDIGGGDVKIYVPIGLLMGPELTLLSLAVFSIVVIIYYFARWLRNRVLNKSNIVAKGIPLVPFITLAVLIVECMTYAATSN